MLEEYFSLVIDKDQLLRAIPLLLGGYQPHLDRLPLCELRLSLPYTAATNVCQSSCELDFR